MDFYIFIFVFIIVFYILQLIFNQIHKILIVTKTSFLNRQLLNDSCSLCKNSGVFLLASYFFLIFNSPVRKWKASYFIILRTSYKSGVKWSQVESAVSPRGKVQIWNPQHLSTFSAPFQHFFGTFSVAFQ